MMDWNKLLNPRRFSDQNSALVLQVPEWQIATARTPIERDYDRILYASATRRMADKTQVFPLERNTSIRTRLTHSHEVSNIARSIGNYLVHEQAPFKDMNTEARRGIPSMLASIGLVHDMGNPPFGHSGEDAISSWFAQRCESDVMFNELQSWPYKNDFLKFEGNAQTLRHLTKLQVSEKSFGLNLTMGTLAAAMKYTVGSGQADPQSDTAAMRKFGFFESERETAQEIFAATGLEAGERHPLAILMEACDDTAYVVLDTEDAVKKKLLSFDQLLAHLEGGTDSVTNHVVETARIAHAAHAQLGLSQSELNDVSMQRFRTLAINAIVTNVIHAFVAYQQEIMQGTFTRTLMKASRASSLVESLRAVDVQYAYNNEAVIALQQHGRERLHAVMDMLWQAIINHASGNAFADYAYGRISENYRRQFEKDHKTGKLPLLYLQSRLLTDQVAGMADGFTLDLHDDLLAMQQKLAA